jgi:hypothetical protein
MRGTQCRERSLFWCCAQEEGLGPEEQQAAMERALSLQRRRSIPLLLHYAPLDLMEGLSEGGAFSGERVLLLGARALMGVHACLVLHHP